MSEILLIEDDPMAQVAVARSLEHDFLLTTCASLAEANSLIQRRKFDLILLDLVLPDGDGLQFLAYLKNSSLHRRIPVITFTGRSGTSDQIMGLSLGADDYIVKPVNSDLLKAKVAARLRHFEQLKRDEDSVPLDDLCLTIDKQKLFISTENLKTEIELTSLEFKMLLYFMKRVDVILSRDQLISAAWGDHVHIIDRTVDGHVSHLRKKISTSSYTIESVRGEGYRLTKKKHP